MKVHAQIKGILSKTFLPTHVDATLKHFSTSLRKYETRDWEGAALKAGKFVESVAKCLMVYCQRPVPKGRAFKAGKELRDLEKLDSKLYNETVRIVIPKACIFVYEVVNNRGGRHDPDEIDANEMDIRVVLPIISWVLAEMIRFATKGNDLQQAAVLIETLSRKSYPFFEEIGGRYYINIDNISAPCVALLLLYYRYPSRFSRKELIESVTRHNFKQHTARVAVERLRPFVDIKNEQLKLRSIGRQ